MIWLAVTAGAFLAGCLFALWLTREDRLWRRYRQAALDELYRQAAEEARR
jgi:hypothetical protein